MEDGESWAEQDQGSGWGDEGQAEDAITAPEVVQVERKPLKDPWRKPSNLTVRHVNAHIFVRAMGKHLKKAGSFELPTWVDLVKTAPSKEMPPSDPDWLYYRIAAVARFMYMHGGCGMGHVRSRYGARKRRGVQPNGYRKAGRGIVRFAFQTLDKLGWAEKKRSGGGRVLTLKGRKEMDNIAAASWQEQKANGRHMPIV